MSGRCNEFLRKFPLIFKVLANGFSEQTFAFAILFVIDNLSISILISPWANTEAYL